MRRHYARRPAGGARGGDAQVEAGGAWGEVGNAQGGGRRWGLTVVRLWRKGDAIVEGYAGKPWPSWGKKGKGEGMTSGSYMSDQFFF